MKNYDKFSEILNSYYNGQEKQFFNQIRSYGKKAFLLDLINNGSHDQRTKLMLLERVIKGENYDK